MNKRIVSGICLLIGTTIGAGFATGKEIVVFFAQYGYLFVPNCLIFCLCFAFMINSFMLMGREQYVISIKEGNTRIISYGRWIVFLVCCTILSGMFSGVKEILTLLYPSHSTVLFFIFFLGMIWISFLNMKGLKTINEICVPCIIIYVICIGLFSPYSLRGQEGEYQVISSILSSLNYSFFNVFVSGFIMMSYAKNLSREEIKKIAIGGSVVISILLAIASIVFLYCDPSLTKESLPFLSVAFSISKLLGWFGIVIIMIAIITSLVSNSVIAKNILTQRRCPTILAVCVPLGVSWGLSFIGFEKIIGYCYPIIGFISMLICVLSTFYTIIKKDKNTLTN